MPHVFHTLCSIQIGDVPESVASPGAMGSGVPGTGGSTVSICRPPIFDLYTLQALAWFNCVSIEIHRLQLRRTRYLHIGSVQFCAQVVA